MQSFCKYRKTQAPRWALLLSLMLNGMGARWTVAAELEYHTTVGLKRLRAEIGEVALPTGAGMLIAQVERSESELPTAFTPLATIPDFADKSFTILPANGTLSWHATGVGAAYYGLRESFTPGPSLIQSYEAIHWMLDGVLHFGTDTLPEGAGAVVVNHSWIMDLGTTPAFLELIDDIYRRVDYLADHEGVFIATGMNNINTPDIPQLLGQGYNMVTVGVSSGDHSAGFTTVAGEGRVKPDILAPVRVTSVATPLVSSAALFLRSAAAAEPALAPATDPRVVKALLLGSASKYKFPGWAQTGTRPLDMLWGAGEFNLYNAHRVLTTGRQPASVTAAVPARGWDFAETSAAGGERTYFFEIPPGNSAHRFTAALVWHRAVNAQQGTAHLANLALEVRSAEAFTPGAVVARSDSPVDNVELLSLAGLAPGRYVLVVSAQEADVPYALVWFSAPTVSLATIAPARLVRDNSAGPVILTFTRAGGDPALQLRVPLVVGGDAVAGEHYAPALPAEVVFAPHESTASIELSPLAAADPLAKDVELNVALAPDFASAPSAASGELVFTLHARPYGVWRAEHFTAAERADPAIVGTTADPDGDGLCNLLEYAFALDPKRMSAGQLPQPFSSADAFGYQFTPPAGNRGIIYGAEWSDDLSEWHPVTNTGTAPQHTFSIPAPGNPGRFLRLKATVP